MSKPSRAVYVEGYIYPSSSNPQPVATTISQLQKSGFESAIVSLFHIGRDYQISPPQITGDIYFNNTLVFSQGNYVGDPSWPGLVNSIIGGKVSHVCASIGGGGVMDYETIKKIYHGNGNSFEGTNLMKNFACLKKILPSVSIIDMDCEETYDQPSFVAFCQMLSSMGLCISFCPYTMQYFWTGSLAALHAAYPGAVQWINLQCYDGGYGNGNPETFDNWASAISDAIPGFDTDGFIIAGDWTNDKPAEVRSLMAPLEGVASFGGGFMWTLDNMVVAGGEKLMAEYAAAIPEKKR